MKDSLEYSTNNLEYGSAGCPAILNRNKLHEELLGENYPLFANTETEYISQLNRALTELATAQKAANRLHTLAKEHTFSKRVSLLHTWLEHDSERESRKKNLLVAGHDLKFFGLLQKKIEETGEFRIIIDKWQGHNKHDEKKSKSLLQEADVIFCEWCLGNIKWYSYNKKPYQRLVGRFHLQEKDLPYLVESNWHAIDHIAYVSPSIMQEAQNIVPFPNEKISIIPNLLDDQKFINNKKMAGAMFTLGIIGVVPARKRFDRALDLLEKLLEKDSRYVLRVKGKSPLDYPWLLKRIEELEYFNNIFTRINSNERLRYKVIFDPAGDDINEWLQMVGFILSPSNFESFHMAIGEGMLTDSVPIIWDWNGADKIWPNQFIVNSTEKAFKLVNSIASNKNENIDCREWVLKQYSVHTILFHWINILNDKDYRK